MIRPMQHLLPFYLFLCLITGAAAGLVMVMVRRRSGFRPLTWFIVFIVGMGVNILSNLFMFYESININKAIGFEYYLLMGLVAPFSVAQFAAGPLFFHGLLEVPYRKAGNRIVLGLAVANCLLSISPLAVEYASAQRHIVLHPGYIVSQSIGLAMIVYTLVVAIAYRKNLADPGQARLVRNFLILSLVFLPGFVHDILFFGSSRSIDELPATIIFYPLFFCVLTGAAALIGVIWLVRRHLGTQALAGEEAVGRTVRLDPATLAALGLSEREAGVAALVAEGLGNKQVAERLGISAKTVNNHLYNIYQKLGINSRYELLVRIGRIGQDTQGL
jgi:DNA-binding CsgD family transcriptional regulator